MIQIKKELKVSKFENIFQQALVNVISTYHWTNQKVKHILLPYEITQQQYNVLRILRAQYPSPSTINLIKLRILDKSSDTSRIIDRLIFKGYVEKSANSYDKRAVDIIIAEKGLTLLKKMHKEIDFSELVSPNLTEEEASQLDVLLDKMKS